MHVKQEPGLDASSMASGSETAASQSPAGSSGHAAENKPPFRLHRPQKRARLSLLPSAAATDDFELQLFTQHLNDRLDSLPLKKRRTAELQILQLLNREEDAAEQAD